MFFPLADNIPHRRPPYVNYGILAACVGVFVYQMLHPELIREIAFRPAYVVGAELGAEAWGRSAWSTLASMFMHGGAFHLLFNMWFLWIFGDNVEDRMGSLRFLLFYLLCGYAATLLHLLIVWVGLPLSGPQALAIPIVGASGAIAGVLGAYYRLFPRALIHSVMVLFFIMFVRVPAALFIMVWFLVQLLSGLGALGMATGGVGFWAHVGGFLAGLVLVPLFARLPRRPPRPRIIDARW